MPTPELARDLPGDLRDALTAACFTYDEVADVLGPVAHAALSRNETTPGIRATRGGTPVETLTRLWLLQAPVPAPAAEAALPGLRRPALRGRHPRALGRRGRGTRRRPSLRHRPGGRGGNLWVASDLTPGLDGAPNAVGSDHVARDQLCRHLAGAR